MGGAPPAGAGEALRGVVMRLRRRLGSGGPDRDAGPGLPDPYSLNSEVEARPAESSPAAVSAASLETGETDPEFRSLEISRAGGQDSAAKNSTADTEPTQGDAQEVEPELAASHSAKEPDKTRKRRGKASFRGLASGIRKFLKSSGRSKSTQRKDRAETEAAETGAAATSEAHQTAAAADGIAALSEKIDGPAMIADRSVNAPEHAQKDAPGRSESFVGSSEVLDAADTLPNLDFVPSAEFTPPSEAQIAEVPQNDCTEASDAASHADFGPSPLAPDPHAFFNQESSQELPQEALQPAEPTPEHSSEELAEPEADSGDDDHAIATAIERYANTKAAATAEAERIANADIHRADFSPDTPATLPQAENHVDINAVLGIPRDPDLEQSTAPNAELFNSGLAGEALAGAEAFALSGSTILPSPAADSLAPELTPATVSASELPESSSARLASTPYRDWSFEEKIASHHEWIESKGATGKKADLTASDLEGSDLIGVDLRFVDLHDANLSRGRPAHG